MSISLIAGYYSCIALSFGIATSYGVLAKANARAREILEDKTAIDERPLIWHLFWIVFSSIAMPKMVFAAIFNDFNETLDRITHKIVKF